MNDRQDRPSGQQGPYGEPPHHDDRRRPYGEEAAPPYQDGYGYPAPPGQEGAGWYGDPAAAQGRHNAAHQPPHDPYATGPYHQQDPYAPQDPYGHQDPYAPHDPYGRQDPYAPHDPYAAQGPYTADPYAPRSPQDPYDAYGRPTAPPDAYGAPGGHEPYPATGPGPGRPYRDDPYGGGAPDTSYGAGQGYAGPPTGAPGVQPQAPGQERAQAFPASPATREDWIPRQGDPPSYERTDAAPHGQAPLSGDHAAPGAGGAGGEDDPAYETEQFSFVEEENEESEDVIDWLKFSESRTERREEAKRRGRSRRVLLCVVLALALVCGAGYLWWSGRLPGLSGGGAATVASGAQKRDVLVVHLRDIDTGESSTALLVDNVTTHRGTTVLLPNDLAVPGDDGSMTTLGKSVKDDGTEPTRDSLNSLLGADVKASWRLDTPYLDSLVETVGGITVTTDTSVPGSKKGAAPLVRKGRDQQLGGDAAVAYATYRGPGEDQARQLRRFGQVMEATLRKVSSDPDGATATIKTLMEVLDPPLTESELGSSLAERAALAKKGAYTTELLPVRADGTLSPATADSVVKNVLGGSVKKTGSAGVARVGVRDATGSGTAAGKAQATITNGGYAYVDGGRTTARATSEVLYGQDAMKSTATQVAKTLGLRAGAVRKGPVAANADVTVVLGRDYRG